MTTRDDIYVAGRVELQSSSFLQDGVCILSNALHRNRLTFGILVPFVLALGVSLVASGIRLLG